MSLSIARSIAYASLTATQVQIAVTSSNIANADTDGYSRKSATQVSTVSGSIGAGVAITGVSSTADALLMKSIVAAHSATEAAAVSEDFVGRLASLMGSVSSSTTDGGTSIADGIAALETALADLAVTPESDSLKAVVVDAVDTVATSLRETSATVQDLRAEADQAIEADVESVNLALHSIDDLNDAIATAAARGDSTADLEDQRNQALLDLSGLMNVSTTIDSDNRMKVYTSSGIGLVTTSVHELSYEAATTVTAQTTYSATPPSGFSAVSVDGTDITATIASGSIGAEIALRDTTLPAVQDELDALAVGLIDALDTATNEGTALPAPTSLTGTVAVAATDAFSASGSLRVALVDDEGTLSSYADVDLSAYATIDDLVAALDGLDGVAARLDDDGHLVLASEDGTLGIALAGSDDVVADGEGFSAAFGLNDLVTGTGASDIRLRSVIAASPSLIATAALDVSDDLAVGDVAIATGSSAVAEALQSALSDDRSFAATGALGARSTSLADYAADILGDVATAASNATSTRERRETTEAVLTDSFASKTGVNLDEESARLSDLEQQYETVAQLLEVLNSMFDALLSTVQS